MMSGILCRAIYSAAGMCAAWLTAETFDGIRLGLIGLEHGQQLRNGEQILNTLGEVQQLQLPSLAAHRGIRADDFTQARAIDVGHAFEVQQQLLLVFLDERIDLFLQKLVALAERNLSFEIQNRHPIDDPLVDLQHRRSSKVRPRWRVRPGPRRWPDVQPPEAPARPYGLQEIDRAAYYAHRKSVKKSACFCRYLRHRIRNLGRRFVRTFRATPAGPSHRRLSCVRARWTRHRPRQGR